ncbi:hypothetical protein NMY22_g20057 [Coprinellus aureogranulatus]|nr:hypothetical protein NMY22_g20057 [Coprinellus aureogranulatus]
MGFKRLQADRSIYIYSRDDVHMIVPVLCDDMTLATKSTEALDRVVAELGQRFKLRDLGETKFILGIEITRDRPSSSISLSQHQYVLDILARFNMSDCNPAPEEVEAMRSTPYLSALGAILYLALMTRPDIAYAVGYLGRFSANPGPKHWAALKHLLRYLKGTADYKLTYKGDGATVRFDTYCDSSHGDCIDTGRSTGAYVTTMAGGRAISWSSKLQTVVCLSSTEAEYIAAVEAGKEILWMRNILGKFGFKQEVLDCALSLCNGIDL